MRSPTSSPSLDCPDLQTWCGYVDGSISGPASERLATHLRLCDRCFATIAELRGDLAAVAETTAPARIDPGPRAIRRAVYAVAATLALLWAGLWTATEHLAPAAGDRVDANSAELFGFVSGDTAATGALRGPVRMLLVFTQFGGTTVTPPPGWAAALFDPARPRSLAAACGGVCEQLALEGVVLPIRYSARFPASAYAAGEPDEGRRRFVREILRQVDADVDLGRHDGDGDGTVDFVLFVVQGVGNWSAAGLGVDYEGDGMQVRGGRSRGAVIDEAAAGAAGLCQLLREAMAP